MPSLITGGTGVLGSALARTLVAAGEEVVLFSRIMDPNRISDIKDKVTCVKGDLTIAAHVLNVVKSNRITDIYHLGAMLTVASEKDPHSSFQTNVLGTINVMEAARLFDVRRMLFSSSIGTFGLETGGTFTDQTIQRPVLFYGIGKLYCEGLGRYYRNKYALDFRCVRYPAIVSPGVNTPGHWIPPMIEDSVRIKQHDCPVSAGMSSWIISLDDAVKAACLIMQAPLEDIRMINYNVTGCIHAIKAEEIAAAIRKCIPDAKINFLQNLNNQCDQWAHVGDYDDSCARKEWGWKPQHDTVDLIVESFINRMNIAHNHSCL